VKHRRSTGAVEPEQIARSARILVEGSLRTVPDAVSAPFLDRIEKLAATLVLWGSKTNLTAHPEDPEEIAFHVIDSLMPLVLSVDSASIIKGQFAQGRSILDLGSGAGFPGLVLAAGSPAHFTLVESRRKRASFLQVAVAEMGLTNATIKPRRAENIGLAGQYDLVTARAFGDVGDFVTIAMGALKSGGLAMLFANPSQQISVAGYRRIEYRVKRRGEEVHRILAIWTRT
jgi:16S rRNA (guanine527-N7)-methyltransferase